jgi:mono/diheme cytochrome c family protein
MRTTLRSVGITAAALGLLLACAGVARADAQDAAKGKEVYAAQKCQMCHAIGGVGNKMSALDGVGAKLSAAELKDWITKPVETAAKMKSTKKPAMPNKYATLPAADVDALVAYLHSLK